VGGTFSPGGDGLRGRFIPEQIERETNKLRLKVGGVAQVIEH
jgi:hypothetical protein